MVIMDLVIQASLSYEMYSIAEALKTGERNPIVQRTFDHYFSAFLQSSNSLKNYEDRNMILQRFLASFAPWAPLTNQQSDTFEKITALICRLQLSTDEVSHIS